MVALPVTIDNPQYQRANRSSAVRIISRDEMNLAEFPLTVLSTRANPSQKTLEFADTIFDKNGKPVKRKWIITAADKFGLPTASDDEVLLGLLKLTVDSGMLDRKVHFTRYELLKVLRWSTEGRSYGRLANALDRLSGVRVKTTNGFYDNESKAYNTKNFGIIDAYEINDGRESENKPSFFIWSEVLFKSFQVGFIKKLDLDFYLKLQSAVSKRLYRYLDKHFWYRSKVKLNLFILAHEKIGISRNYRYPSSLRQQLDGAIEELVAEGFLSHVEYEGRGKGTEVVFYAARGKPRSVANEAQTSEGEGHASEQDQKGSQSICSLLIERNIADVQARKLTATRSKDELERMKKIIDYYDSLVTSSSALISRNPAGFLYRAVQKPEQFVLPGESRQGQMNFEATRKPAAASGQTGPNIREQREDRMGEYLTERKEQIERIRQNVEPETLDRVTGEVREALAKVQGLISEEGFARTLEHGVNEKLAKLFALPDYDEWIQVAPKRKASHETVCS